MDKRGTPEEFSKMKLSAMLLRMVYPTVISDFANHMEVNEIRERVFRIGKNSGSQFYEYYKIRGKKLVPIIKRMFKQIWDSKVKVKKEGDDHVYHLISKNCPVCGDLPPLELPELHYCIPVAGFLEGYLNEMAKHKDLGFQPGSIKCTTLQSVCTHESKTCIHKLIIEGGSD
ncbi:MAG: hypothetical protein EAX96_15055 [Candidatus Lokiarchaeota archaeon]|nr:hypothetical protein [Candidatus Lokiarchaeota archaeon]